MNIIEALIFGLIQGLTEFIPVSSTAHMTLAAKLMGVVNNDEHWTAFMAIVQIGTLIAVLFYFAEDIKLITRNFVSENVISRIAFKNQSVESKQGWLVIIGSVPIIIIGLALKKIIEGELTKNVTLIATMLIVVSIILYIAERVAKQLRSMEDVTWKDSIIIGISQAMALIPGSSRSGTTITAGLFLGLKRETAARFSFLLSIPAITGSGLLELVKTLKYINANDLVSLVLATAVAGISGYISIAFLMRYLRTNTTMIFIVYRIILGLLVLAFMR